MVTDSVVNRVPAFVTSNTFQSGALALAIVAASYSFFRNPPALSASENDDLHNLSFWNARWETGATRWHKTHPHPSLQQYLDDKILSNFPGGGARVLVPLCGKSVDLKYLAQKRKVAKVVGVDGIYKAAKEFAKENPDLDLTDSAAEKVGSFRRLEGLSMEFLIGDFFDVDQVATGGSFDAVWDRGALVAVKPDLRDAYVQKLGELLNSDSKVLLSTYVRPNGDVTSGPPFSIDEAEVRKLFEGRPWVASVELLDSHSAIAMEKWYKAIVLYWRMGNAQEKIFLITTKGDTPKSEISGE
jgi:thiopurine S-methyltransferase